MATVRLEFTPEPAHVRTARLVGVAVARRAGVPDDQLDEVRLAIGEACARAVARHQRVGLRDVVAVAFTDGDRYVVQVWDHAGDEEQITDEEQLTVDVSASLLQAIVKDLQVRPLEGGPGTEVQMAWPVRRASRLGR
ncbi:MULTISPECIES: ATP-binding protein [Catellatospora]|uniref:Anti-sigma regulatory factor n=1 Tax=Catellatospora citrea TaxID=53366 RepID=A0A8J3KPE5_9ACTN|nr:MULTISPECIES: ATP-binding protein [Catellatospora]RKE09189.1 histidine kinase-like protein [Catellatospora citrea]GIF99634.1 anti-sigma regulatory factor [Catellatospora citrea]